MERIGLFGGSFNPVHIGHTMLASYMAQFGGFDKVWMLLSPQNPLKVGDSDLIDDNHRLAMLEIALSGSEQLEVCDIELTLPRPGYTIDTLRALDERYGATCRFTPIIGADNWIMFDRWKSGPEIVARYGVTIYPRPGYPLAGQPLPEGVRMVDAPVIELSSTFIRQSIAGGHDMTYFLPPGVATYIRQHHLYLS